MDQGFPVIYVWMQLLTRTLGEDVRETRVNYLR